MIGQKISATYARIFGHPPGFWARFFICTTIFSFCAGSYFGIMMLTGNFHEVIKGELYRSAQLEPGDLQRIKDDYGVKTVLNLRGPNPNEPWYQAEVRDAKEVNINLIDFGFSAKHKLPYQKAWQLINIMQHAEKPLLIHCKSGIDRTGLATALYLASIKKADEFTSELQMSLLYGHIPLPWSPFYAVNDSFEDMEPSLGYAGS